MQRAVYSDASVRDHIPLEQGLRPAGALTDICAALGQRPYSIRTRIKTYSPAELKQLLNVRDHIPLEQGLRLIQIWP